jgi:hypothetical protein
MARKTAPVFCDKEEAATAGIGPPWNRAAVAIQPRQQVQVAWWLLMRCRWSAPAWPRAY